MMRHKVALIVPGQGIDTSSDNPAGKLQLQILGAVSEFERSVIRERVNAGLAAAKAKGVKLGRPRTWTVMKTRFDIWRQKASVRGRSPRRSGSRWVQYFGSYVISRQGYRSMPSPRAGSFEDRASRVTATFAIILNRGRGFVFPRTVSSLDRVHHRSRKQVVSHGSDIIVILDYVPNLVPNEDAFRRGLMHNNLIQR